MSAPAASPSGPGAAGLLPRQSPVALQKTSAPHISVPVVERLPRAPPTPGPVAAADIAGDTSLDLSLQSPLWHRKDGRVRNAVPSKLLGKTDETKGNFIVMQMGLTTNIEAVERSAAAKRISESTELAAKLAQKDGYKPLKRAKHIVLPEVATESNKPKTAPTASQTKEEQTRLLALLRSLSPALVVDQICKALAFFGGVPGAPPPPDGVFPQSAEANGPGPLFVGWIGEIFPRLSVSGGVGQKRRRGRPKGSKSTKTRKDKGVKKHPSAAPGDPGKICSTISDAAPDSSWVDVDDGGPGPGPELLADSDGRGGGYQREENTASGYRVAGGDMQPPTTAPGAGRRRGRPKGSKNRPKDPATVVTANQEQPRHRTPRDGGSIVDAGPASITPMRKFRTGEAVGKEIHTGASTQRESANEATANGTSQVRGSLASIEAVSLSVDDTQTSTNSEGSPITVEAASQGLADSLDLQVTTARVAAAEGMKRKWRPAKEAADEDTSCMGHRRGSGNASISSRVDGEPISKRQRRPNGTMVRRLPEESVQDFSTIPYARSQGTSSSPISRLSQAATEHNIPAQQTHRQQLIPKPAGLATLQQHLTTEYAPTGFYGRSQEASPRFGQSTQPPQTAHPHTKHIPQIQLQIKSRQLACSADGDNPAARDTSCHGTAATAAGRTMLNSRSNPSKTSREVVHEQTRGHGARNASHSHQVISFDPNQASQPEERGLSVFGGYDDANFLHLQSLGSTMEHEDGLGIAAASYTLGTGGAQGAQTAAVFTSATRLGQASFDTSTSSTSLINLPRQGIARR